MYFPAFAKVSIFLHSASPCALTTLTSLSGSIFLITFFTALATPPLAANPLPSAEDVWSSSSTSNSENSIDLASNIPISSSNVRTKSTSLLTLRLLASSFLAAHGPIKTTLQSGWSFLIIRPVKTIGVSAIEIQFAYSGKVFFAITDHAGQQLVPIKGIFSGTSSRKSSAS